MKIHLHWGPNDGTEIAYTGPVLREWTVPNLSGKAFTYALYRLGDTLHGFPPKAQIRFVGGYFDVDSDYPESQRPAGPLGMREQLLAMVKQQAKDADVTLLPWDAGVTRVPQYDRTTVRFTIRFVYTRLGLA